MQVIGRSKGAYFLRRMALWLVAVIAIDGITANLTAGQLAVVSSDVAEAFRGGGGRIGGGGGRARVSTRTTVRPGRGVTRSTTVAGGRYYNRPAARPGYDYRPGVYPAAGVRGVARRTARRTTRRVAYRTASGYSYYYGSPMVVLPSSACYSVIWEGMSAYNCNGLMYIWQDGQYYPIEGA